LADVLSQSEIDALLSKFGSGEMVLEPETKTEETPIVEYDFRTANRFHKEQIRTLGVIYDNFARLFSTYLSGTLRVLCATEVISVEELKYQEFVNALPSPVVLAILNHPPLSGPVLFEISPDIAFAMISRLLGGSMQHGAPSRNFTEIELMIIERVLRQFLPLFVESWERIVRVSVSLDRIETSPQFAQIVSSSEPVAIITLSINIGEVAGLISICLPHLALEAVNQHLSTKFMYSSGSGRKGDPEHENIAARIRTTPLDVTAMFNNTFVPVREILSLAPGDVLQLEHKTAEPLTLMVGHLPKFHVELGVKEKHLAVRIADIIYKEESE
jgi:flagellar motor switch protein FliM